MYENTVAKMLLALYKIISRFNFYPLAVNEIAARIFYVSLDQY